MVTTKCPEIIFEVGLSKSIIGWENHYPTCANVLFTLMYTCSLRSLGVEEAFIITNVYLLTENSGLEESFTITNMYLLTEKLRSVYNVYSLAEKLGAVGSIYNH